MRELLIGCGHNREKQIDRMDPVPGWSDLTTLDFNESCGADVVWDLNKLPLPFADESFDEIHAYEVLEHVGTQGDYRFFFDQFTDFWRILRPEGRVIGTVPRWDSIWAWGDPSHTRVINHGTIHFLSQDSYKEVDYTGMTDFRSVYKADFEIEGCDYKGEKLAFILRKR